MVSPQRSGWWWSTAALCAVLALATSPAHSGEPDGDRSPKMADCQRTIRTSQDPVARFEAVRALARCDERGVADALSDLVRSDDDVAVRVEAARGLGITTDPLADKEALDLLGEGGLKDVRKAVAASLGARGVALAEFSKILRSPAEDDFTKERVVAALASHPDPMAAALLEMAAATGDVNVRPAALEALAANATGAKALPDVLFQVLSSSNDVDLVVTALSLWQQHGTARLADLDMRLRGLGSPAVDGALDVALAHVEAREARRRAGPKSLQPFAEPVKRDLVDRVHVFHQGTDMPLFWKRLLRDLRESKPRFEDVRVAIVAYSEPLGAGRPSGVKVLPFTRDEQKIAAFFATLNTQYPKPKGVNFARAITSALARAGWRWDARRTVDLHTEIPPLRMRDTVQAASLHHTVDHTDLRVFYVDRWGKPCPDELEELAGAAGGVPVPPLPGEYPKPTDPTNPDPQNNGGKKPKQEPR